MNSWIFRVYPDNDTPFKQFCQDGVIAIGWKETNEDDAANWKERYPLQLNDLWKNTSPSKNKKTPNATPSFEILLVRMKPGDFILAVHGDGARCKILGVGKLEAAPDYNYFRAYPPKDADQAERKKKKTWKKW